MLPGEIELLGATDEDGIRAVFRSDDGRERKIHLSMLEWQRIGQDGLSDEFRRWLACKESA